MALSTSTPGDVAEARTETNISLAVRRLAAAIATERIVAVGDPSAFRPLEVTAVDRASQVGRYAGVVVLDGASSWEGLVHGRLVVALPDVAAGDVLAGIASTRAQAEAAGWEVAHSGLLHAADERGHARRETGLVIACRAGDPLADALAIGPLSLGLDPALRISGSAPRPARVLIASYEITGPTGNGGIGTAYHSLAHALARAGHHVTVLYTGWLSPERAAQEEEWRAAFAEAGIAFELLGTPWDSPVRSPHYQVRRAYEFHRWLAEAQTRRPFDVAHLPETLGHGAFAMTAKRLGLAYRDLEFVVGTHSSTRWIAESNREGIDEPDSLVAEHLERVSVESADVVVSPSAYMLDYMRVRGWRLPERTFVQPYARPQSVRELRREHAAAGRLTELVFFGRLETRKGLEAFCDAVDLLHEEGCPFEQVTFLGRPERVLGAEASGYVAHRAARWQLGWKILPDCGHDEAIAYLRAAPCVVASPSLVDNAPNTVSEVIALGIPFVASRSGGTAELIRTEDLARSTFDGWRAAETLEPPTLADAEERFDACGLADALRTASDGAHVPPAPAVDDGCCDVSYDLWHRAIAGRRRTVRTSPGALPTTAVVIVADDAGAVAQIRDALAVATDTSARVVAVGDLPDRAVAGVEVVRAAGRDTGPARRQIAAESDAELLIVLRGSTRPDPDLVAHVRAAMARTDTDVLSLVSRDPVADRATDVRPDLRRGDAPGDLRAFVPVGGPAVVAALYPALAVGGYAIRATALQRLGGYAVDLWGEALDDELLSRAALAGMRIDVLPDPLLTTVADDRWTEVRTRHWGPSSLPEVNGEEQIRLLRPFRLRLDEQLGDLPALLVGTARRASEAAVWSLRAIDGYEERIAEYVDLFGRYEEHLTEHRDLIALYERQKAELADALAAALATAKFQEPTRAQRIAARLRHAGRSPVSALPGRTYRFARWQLERRLSSR